MPTDTRRREAPAPPNGGSRSLRSGVRSSRRGVGLEGLSSLFDAAGDDVAHRPEERRRHDAPDGRRLPADHDAQPAEDLLDVPLHGLPGPTASDPTADAGSA